MSEKLEITEIRKELPSTLKDLSKFVLIGREKLNAVRAEIRAIDKVGLAKDVREQKLREAQDVADAVLDAEVRIGQLMSEIPKASKGQGVNQYTKNAEIDSGVEFSKPKPEKPPEPESNPTAAFFADLFGPDAAEDSADNSEVIKDDEEDPEDMLDRLFGDSEDESEPVQTPKPQMKTKADVIRESGFTQKQVERFQTMAAHPEIVAQAKAEARENDDIVSRTLIINKIKQEKKEQSRAERDKAIAEQISRPSSDNHVDIYTTDRKYRVIYADPPWSYGDKQNIDGLGGAEKHYPTMPLADICALPVPAEENAVLFLWVTSPMLEDCFKVINAWGFKYKSSFVWDKVAHNMGHYNSVRHEFLLVCTRGSCTPDVKKLYDSVQSIERTEHSRKPAEFREIIDTIYPSGRRLEMFAREAPAGWDVWGNMA